MVGRVCVFFAKERNTREGKKSTPFSGKDAREKGVRKSWFVYAFCGLVLATQDQGESAVFAATHDDDFGILGVGQFKCRLNAFVFQDIT